MPKIYDLVQSNLYNNVSHQETLEKLLVDAKQVKVICPYISQWGADWLLKSINPEAKLDIITELSLRGIISGVQDPDVIKKFMKENFQVYYMTTGLHAKLYWIDRKYVFITSANLTKSGMADNIELGVLLQEGDSFVGQYTKGESLTAYVTSLWNFFKKGTEEFSQENFEHFKNIKDKCTDIRNKVREALVSIEDEMPFVPYNKNQRDIPQKDLVNTDLLISDMFSGFKITDWDIFFHDLELNDINLINFKEDLTKKVNPLLNNLYTQLKHEAIFKSTLTNLQGGFSLNRRLKKSFPTNRYLFLTKEKKGKRPNKHIEIPSFILGFGVTNKSPWIEIRTGVEEINAGGLTLYGENFLRQIRLDVDKFLEKVKSLGKGWYLSHGDYNVDAQEFIQVEDINKDQLIILIEKYGSVALTFCLLDSNPTPV